VRRASSATACTVAPLGIDLGEPSPALAEMHGQLVSSKLGNTKQRFGLTSDASTAGARQRDDAVERQQN
jgi:hypothetical protein